MKVAVLEGPAARKEHANEVFLATARGQDVETAIVVMGLKVKVWLVVTVIVPFGSERLTKHSNC